MSFDPTQLAFLLKFGHVRGVWEWETNEKQKEVTVVGPTCQSGAHVWEWECCTEA
jgi:hypothetical protein